MGDAIRFVQRLWPILGLQAGFVLTLAVFSSRPIPFEFSRPLMAALAIWIAGLTLLVVRAGLDGLRAGGDLGKMRASLLDSRDIVVRAFLIALIAGMAIALHGWGKSMLPHIIPYWADVPLADLDRAVFGRDPWEVFRIEALRSAFAATYLWWFPVTFGTLGIIAFSAQDRSAALMAFLLTLIVGGTLGQYVLPSAGPIFFERMGLGDRFADLVATNEAAYNRFANYLWYHYSSDSAALGTGISAMPSMHVALGTWVALAWASIWRPALIIGLVYVAMLWGASIASGWHYASDGLLGILVALAAWRLASPFTTRLGER